MIIATLIAAERLTVGDISAAEDRLASAGTVPRSRRWVEPERACDLLLASRPAEALSLLEGLFPGVDVVVQEEAVRRKRLLVADMDSTMITVECIDELADYAGVGSEVAAVTERAMQGEMDFGAALAARVALLGGLKEAVIERCYAERVRITPGARQLVRTMRRTGARCILVSGGFTRFADRVAAEIGFDSAVANRLHIVDGRLAGTVELPILGAQAKRQALIAALDEFGIDRSASMAIGDGANDIPMLKEAGLGVAYHAKPAADEAADARIRYGDLSALLYAQGYPRAEWEED